MPNVNTQFQGQTLVLPGAYYADDVSGTAATNPGFVPPVLLIGNTFGGVPKVPVTFSSASDLLKAIRGGPLADFVPFLYNPSGSLNGASQVTLIPVGENTQSSFALQGAGAGGAATFVNLTSVDYGAPSNLLQVSVSPASNGLPGAVKVTLFDGYDNAILTGDDLGVPLSVAYLGAQSGVVLSFPKTNGVVSALQITSVGAGESVLVPIGPGQYETVGAVAEYLNGTGFYSATVESDGRLAATGFDGFAQTLPPPSGGVPVEVPLTAYGPDVVAWFANYCGDRVTATLNSAYVAGNQFYDIPLTHFSGGTNVPPVLADYAAALNVALGVPGWVLVMDSNSAGVRALGAQHAITASGVSGRRPRRYVTGSSPGDTIASAEIAAQGLNAAQATYVYPGVYRTDTRTGLNRLYGGLYEAAAVAGMMAGNPVATPLTNKPLVGNGVETALTVSQIDALQRAGVMVLARNDAGVPSIVSDLTTWQNDSNPSNVFNQQVAIRQYLDYLLVGALQPYAGTIASPYGGVRARNAAVTALNGAIWTPSGNGPSSNGVLASWDPKSLALTYTGATQTLAVSVKVTPVGQNRFITIFAEIQPLNYVA